VGAVKGAILSVNPGAVIVDITHEIPPQDIAAAAFTLLAGYAAFPPGTINVVVVDPGVGSTRKAILIQAGGQFFVGPDNGIFSYVCEREESQGAPVAMFELTNAKYFRHPVSPTFHGRDVFAPVAAALSQGINAKALGTRITRIVRLASLKPVRERRKIRARIINVDHFGNCVTNLTREELTPELIAAGARLQIGRKVVKSFRQHFAAESGHQDQLFGIWGSAGFLEIAAANESAARLLGARRGDGVVVVLS
jgi:S-adenosyl-L-methionine hydrolase (adenosine-forming)